MLLSVVSNSYTPLVYIVAALLTGTLIPLLYQIARNWRRKPLEDQEIIEKTVRNELGNLKDLLAEYRLEVEVNKRQLEDYRKQLGEVTFELSRAQVRITYLEDALRTAKTDHETVKRELEEAKARREALQEERDRLNVEAEELRGRIKELEDKTGITERIAVASRHVGLPAPPQEE